MSSGSTAGSAAGLWTSAELSTGNIADELIAESTRMELVLENNTVLSIIHLYSYRL